MASVRRIHEMPDRDVVYAEPHDHRAYGHDHAVRVAATKAMGEWLADWKKVRSVADLSCGNADIAFAVTPLQARPIYLGDYAPGYEYTGPIEETCIKLWQDTNSEGVDLFVCCETIEHLEDPGYVLRLIWHTADYLLLSTPINNWGDSNAEHLWAWDRSGVTELFTGAGWRELAFTTTKVVQREGGVYTYGIWALEAGK